MEEAPTNVRLKQLVSVSALPPAVALTIFNRGLGPQACTASVWNAYLSDPRSASYQELPGHLLTHAETQFARAA
jgi:hypothetical protein